MIGLRIVGIINKDSRILELIIHHHEDNQLDKINLHHLEEQVQLIKILDKKDLVLKWEHQQIILGFTHSPVDFTKDQIFKLVELQVTIQILHLIIEKAKF